MIILFLTGFSSAQEDVRGKYILQTEGSQSYTLIELADNSTFYYHYEIDWGGYKDTNTFQQSGKWIKLTFSSGSTLLLKQKTNSEYGIYLKPKGRFWDFLKISRWSLDDKYKFFLPKENTEY